MEDIFYKRSQEWAKAVFRLHNEASLGAKRDTSAFIPYRWRSGDDHFEFFLQRRSADAQFRPGFLGFFGGGIEKGETPKQAMLRETKEELDFSPSKYFYFKKYRFPTANMHIFYARVNKNFQRRVRVLEGDYGKFFTLDELYEEEKVAPSAIIVLTDLLLHKLL